MSTMPAEIILVSLGVLNIISGSDFLVWLVLWDALFPDAWPVVVITQTLAGGFVGAGVKWPNSVMQAWLVLRSFLCAASLTRRRMAEDKEGLRQESALVSSDPVRIGCPADHERWVVSFPHRFANAPAHHSLSARPSSPKQPPCPSATKRRVSCPPRSSPFPSLVPHDETKNHPLGPNQLFRTPSCPRSPSPHSSHLAQL